MMDLHETQSQIFDKLSVNEKKALDAMQIENIVSVIDYILVALHDKIPVCLIEPFPLEYREQNKYIQQRIEQLMK